MIATLAKLDKDGAPVYKPHTKAFETLDAAKHYAMAMNLTIISIEADRKTHTPGPWEIEVPTKGQDGYPDNWSINHNGSERAVYVASIPGAVNIAEAKANANLISAAPALLEALITALPYVEMAETDETYKETLAVAKVVHQMVEAIEHALGE